MDVCVLPAWFYDVEGNGGGVFFREQALALQPHLKRIDIFYPALHLRYWNNAQRLHRQVNNVDEYIFQAPTPPKRGLFLKWFQYNILRGFRWYLNARGDKKPDLIHAHSFWGAYAAFIIKKKFEIPYVYTEHLGRWSKKTIVISEFYRKYLPIISLECSILSSVSSALAANLYPYYNSKQFYITPNLVDTDYFRPITSTNKLKEKGNYFKLISIGDPWHTKGIDIILEAIALLPEQLQIKIQLSLVDNLPNREVLMSLIAKYRLENMVHFLGRLERDDLKNLLQTQDVLISASRHESFGVTMIEALACGVPVVASRTAGALDIVKPEVGILVDVGASDQLAAALLACWQQPERFPVTSLAEYAQQTYGLSAFRHRWSTLYQKALNEPT